MKSALFKCEREIVAAFAEVLIPLQASSEEMPRLLDSVDGHVALMTREMRFLFRLCLWVFELSAFFYYGKMRLMSRMDVSLRVRYVAAWHHTWWSVKRTMKRYLETIVFMNYYGLPDVAEKVCGFTPEFAPPLGTCDFPSVNLVTSIPEADIDEEVDVCVIGSGAGGSVVAKELAEKGRSVIVLEEGGFFTGADVKKDVVAQMKRFYRNGGVVNTFGWPAILVPVGCCVGGTTFINSGTCFRTPDPVFERWVAEFGLTGWSPFHMRTSYEAVEKVMPPAAAEEKVQSRAATLFETGLKKMGHKLMPLARNAPKCCGSGTCPFGCPTNAKQSMQLNYIPLALQAGARVYANCRAKRIVYGKRHATEVIGEFFDRKEGKRGALIRVKAKAIVVACGSLHTPLLLNSSGIPDVSGQIGKNLTLHPAAKVMALFDDDVRGWRGIPQGYFCDALVPEGVMLEGIFLPPAFTASTLLLTGAAHRAAMGSYNRLAMFGMMVSDTTRGAVLKGFRGQPIAVYNINRHDLPKYRRGIRFLADAFFEAGARKLFLPFHTLPEVSREEGVGPIIEHRLRNKDLDLQAFHPLGTCRMGADPREAVLDPNARLYGLDNLFVADGSIFPTSLGVNPMLTIMAAAYKISNTINRDIL